MAERNPDVKSGGGGGASGTQVAVVTALIGAAATVTVALINRMDAKDSTATAPSPAASAAPAPAALVAPSPAAEPAAFTAAPETVANVAGTWRSNDGEQIEIGQSGASLTVSGATATEAGPVVAAGAGRIDGRDVSWTMQLVVQGNQIEADCRGRLTVAGNSLQGTCNVMGEKLPFLYNR